MADVQIITAGLSHVDLMTELHNEIFRPIRDVDFFKRRFLGRYNVILQFAQLDGRPIAFIAGFELKPATYYLWLCGVHPEFRGMSVARQLVEGLHAWALDHEYSVMRLECHNRHREVLRIAIDLGYDIVGVRYDMEREDHMVIFEKRLRESDA